MAAVRIVIVGGTGLVGSNLAIELVRCGHEIIVASRNPQSTDKHIAAPHQSMPWPNLNPTSDHQNIDAIINLAGENLASGKWDEDKKSKIIQSRIDATQQVADFISKCYRPPKVWINASGIGYYGDRKDERLDENSLPGDGFLADICKEWEKTVDQTSFESIRKISLRIGVVLSRRGGALEKMLPAFQNHMGGSIAGGQQWMSWIHEDDLIAAICFCLINEQISGAVNGVSPEPVTNTTFTKSLGSVLKKLTLCPLPAFLLKKLFGDKSCLLLDGQRVYPKALLNSGFEFKFTHVKDALLDLCGLPHSPPHIKIAAQWLPISVDECFKFFCDEKNLESITPQQLNFKVLSKTTPHIKKGCRIFYKLKLHGIIPLKWETLILTWEPPKQFSDIQLAGPYKHWNHRHRFETLGSGTLMKDEVNYQLPLGPIGRCIQWFIVKRDIENIFDHRYQVIQKKFGSSLVLDEYQSLNEEPLPAEN